MAKRNFKASAKKSLAVVSAIALLLSCGTIGMFTVNAAEADSTQSLAKNPKAATQMYIYDKNGNDITNSHLIYVDNSSAAGQPTSEQITVKIVNANGELDDEILVSEPMDSNQKHCAISYNSEVYNKNENSCEATFTLSGCTHDIQTLSDPITGEPYKDIVEIPFEPGTENLTFFTKSGEVSRPFTVVTLQPATDMNVYWGSGNNRSKLDVNDYVMSNSAGVVAVANHKYNLYADVIGSSTDEVEWSVYEGIFNKYDIDSGYEPEETRKAEISQQGVFTPKENGNVTIVAYYAATARARRGVFSPEDIVTDRPYAIGTKLRRVPSPKIDIFFSKYYSIAREGGLPNGRILYENELKTISVNKQPLFDNNGNYITETTSVTPTNQDGASIKFTEEVDGNGRLILTENEQDGKYGTINLYKPVYTDLINVPKYINVYIIKENPAKSMTFSNPISAMEINDTHKLEIEAEPTYKGDGYDSGATDVYTWKSSNPSVATVDQYGLVTAVKRGDTKITAYGENQKVYAECNITVLTKASKVEISPKPTSVRIGQSIELTATMSPTDANEEIVWYTEDGRTDIVKLTPTTVGELTNVQTVLVEGLSTGTTYVIAKAKNSGFVDKCQVTVNDKIPSDDLAVSTVIGDKITKIPQDSKDYIYTHPIYTTQDITFDSFLTGPDGSLSDDEVIWHIEGNDSDYVTVLNQDARQDIEAKQIVIHGASEGTVKVTAYAKSKPDKVKVSFNVEVRKSCDYITIKNISGNSVSSKSLNVGESYTVMADLTTYDVNNPRKHSDGIASWTSSEPEIASVDDKGNITAIKNGYANIIVKTLSGKENYISIYVFTTSSVILQGDNIKLPDSTHTEPYTNVTMYKDYSTGNLIADKYFYATVYDQNNQTVSNFNCTWTSDNENVATIDSSGHVTAKDIGQTTITVKSGSKSQSCILYVYAPMDASNDIELDPMIYSPFKTAYEPHPTFTVGGRTLKEGRDYTVEYFDNKGIGYAYMKVTGIGEYKGEKYVYFSIVSKNISEPEVKVSNIEKQKCTGNELYPDFTITYTDIDTKQEYTLVKNTDYEVYYASNVFPGTCTITITGIGNFVGQINTSFDIYCNHEHLKDLRTIKEPTRNDTGVEEGTCEVCREVVQRSIPVKTVVGMCGNLDGDEDITANDALLILRASVNLETFDFDQTYLADIDGDGTITSADSLSVLRYSVGLKDANSKVGEYI